MHKKSAYFSLAATSTSKHLSTITTPIPFNSQCAILPTLCLTTLSFSVLSSNASIRSGTSLWRIGPFHTAPFGPLKHAILGLDYNMKRRGWDLFTKLLNQYHKDKAGFLPRILANIDRFIHMLVLITLRGSDHDRRDHV